MMPDLALKWFGPSWRAPINDDADECPVPVGERCEWCQEVFGDHDQGVKMSGKSYHVYCHVRLVIGSVSHQLKKCSCYGGTWEDPPELTLRESAKLAAELFWEENRRSARKFQQLGIDDCNE